MTKSDMNILRGVAMAATVAATLRQVEINLGGDDYGSEGRTWKEVRDHVQWLESMSYIHATSDYAAQTLRFSVIERYFGASGEHGAITRANLKTFILLCARHPSYYRPDDAPPADMLSL